MKDLLVEWDRFNDFTTARPSGTSSSTSAPMDIGTTLQGTGTTWNRQLVGTNKRDMIPDSLNNNLP